MTVGGYSVFLEQNGIKGKRLLVELLAMPGRRTGIETDAKTKAQK